MHLDSNTVAQLSGYKENCKKLLIFFLGSLLLFSAYLGADEAPLTSEELKKIYHYHPAVEDSVWRAITPYLLPANHPVKKKLDAIFSKYRVVKNMNTLMTRGGFDEVAPQKWTRLIVTKHSKIPGYVFKIYLDKQHFHRKKPEHYFWIHRCQGAEMIRQEIKNHRWQHFLKVPHKWIYPMPPKPEPSPGKIPKYFILVEEDMDIYDSIHNAQLWGSPLITKEKLDAVFYIMEKHGFWDCAKPDNIPIGKDGRIAFVDTQTYHSWPVGFHKLYPVLSLPMLAYWQGLVTAYKENKTMPIAD